MEDRRRISRKVQVTALLLSFSMLAPSKAFPILSWILGMGIQRPPTTREGPNYICIYSTNPDKFEPKCFRCPRSAFTNIVSACVDDPSRYPANISFAEGNCIEKNCAINYPRGATTIQIGDMRGERENSLPQGEEEEEDSGPNNNTSNAS